MYVDVIMIIIMMTIMIIMIIMIIIMIIIMTEWYNAHIIGLTRTFGIVTQFQSTYLNYIFINRSWFQIVDIGMQPVIIKCHVLQFFKFIFLLSWLLKKENRNIKIKIITFNSLISWQKMFTKFSIRVILHTPFLKIL